MKHTHFVTERGVPMVCRVVFPGDNYGCEGRLVAEGTLVEFYDGPPTRGRQDSEGEPNPFRSEQVGSESRSLERAVPYLPRHCASNGKSMGCQHHTCSLAPHIQ